MPLSEAALESGRLRAGVGPPPTATPLRVLLIVICSIAALAGLGLGSLCLTLFFKTSVDPTILTALITLTSTAVGALTGMLINTRQPPRP